MDSFLGNRREGMVADPQVFWGSSQLEPCLDPGVTKVIRASHRTGDQAKGCPFHDVPEIRQESSGKMDGNIHRDVPWPLPTMGQDLAVWRLYDH